MKISMTISPFEAMEILKAELEKRTGYEVLNITIQSHASQITIECCEGGIIEADQFRHALTK